MAGDPQKTPAVQTLNAFGDQKVAEHIERLGQGLPCHVTKVTGQIVTVAFDIAETGATLPSVTIPIATWKYDWEPVQVGDQGFTTVATARLGGVSGLGGGTADLSQPANLTALVFVPIANKSWTVPNVNQRVVQGPEGVLIQTLDGTVTMVISETGVTINGNIAITGNLTATGVIVAGQGTGDQVGLQTHRHGTGTAASGTVAPTPGT